MHQTQYRLFRLLTAKSIGETLFVSTLAVVFFYTAFPPHFHGWGEATPDAIAGWAVNHSAPWDRVELQLFVDGKFVANGIANLSRPDVAAAGWSRDEWHGYAFPAPPLSVGVHEARVYAIHESGDGIRRTLQPVGSPIHFAFDENGKLSQVSTGKP